jgi:hypothetical protein
MVSFLSLLEVNVSIILACLPRVRVFILRHFVSRRRPQGQVQSSLNGRLTLPTPRAGAMLTAKSESDGADRENGAGNVRTATPESDSADREGGADSGERTRS